MHKYLLAAVATATMKLVNTWTVDKGAPLLVPAEQ